MKHKIPTATEPLRKASIPPAPPLVMGPIARAVPFTAKAARLFTTLIVGILAPDPRPKLSHVVSGLFP